MRAAGKKNRLKMKNSNQLWPLRRATRAGQNAMATQMMTANRLQPNQAHPDIANMTVLLDRVRTHPFARRRHDPEVLDARCLHPEWTVVRRSVQVGSTGA